VGDERITITLPAELLHEIDRHDPNRSRFVREAIRHSLDYRRRLALKESLAEPHPETGSLESKGFDEWARELPAEGLIDPGAGVELRWVEGTGWEEVEP
jgi:Arc/MetJ-type ribon-helix-helix transcriptional regulator